MHPLNKLNRVLSVKALLTAGSRLAVVAVITLAGLTATARATPLTLFVFPSDYDCSGSQLTIAEASGGQPPYIITWTNVAQAWGSPGDSPNLADLYMDFEATVTVMDANGQTKAKAIYIYPTCHWRIRNL
ncbi:MAG: hypothetical protein ABW208_18045 [Pyrinomonadaceae bacterium]